MANSAFRISEGKKYESTFGECSGSSFVVNETNHDNVTKISDIMVLKYENNQCPVVGDLVRWSMVNNALTLADAEYNTLSTTGVDPESSSEVVGVIEEVINACGPEFNRDEVTARVVFFGKIDFSDHMGNKKLTPGKVYYLNDSTEAEHNHPDNHVFRNATSREPNMVSKPVYIATSPSTAIITNFRGLMGGQADYVIDEILLTIECDSVGFYVEIKNNGSETWKTPIDSISSDLDPLDGSSAVGSIVKNWGSYDEFNEWQPTLDPMLQSAQLILTPGESVSYRIGTEVDTKLGKLQVMLSSNSQVRASESKICVPTISVISECFDAVGNTSELPRFLLNWNNASQKMISPLKYIIQEKDDQGVYVDVTTQDNTEFQLPSLQNDETWYVNVYDRFDPSHSGDYRIVFPDVIEGHWAFESLGSGYELSCIREIKCECGNDFCLVEPRNIEKRKTYGPLMAAFELDGVTEVGSEGQNRSKYPGISKDMIIDLDGSKKDIWAGKTSRLNEDGTNGRLCGSTVESGEPMHPNFSFFIPDDGAICVPKLKESEVNTVVGYEIEVWKNKEMKELEVPAVYKMNSGDVPKDPSKQTATIFLDFNAETGEYENCFDITLDGSNKTYFIDEMVT
jgi:hypothetical protein